MRRREGGTRLGPDPDSFWAAVQPQSSCAYAAFTLEITTSHPCSCYNARLCAYIDSLDV